MYPIRGVCSRIVSICILVIFAGGHTIVLTLSAITQALAGRRMWTGLKRAKRLTQRNGASNN